MPKLQLKYKSGRIEQVDDTPENRLKYGFKEESQWSGDTYLKAAKGLGSFAVESLPSVGAVLAKHPAGYVAGSAVKQGLQEVAPSLFGTPEENIPYEYVKDFALNKLGDKYIPPAVNALGRGVNDLIFKLGKHIQLPFAQKNLQHNLDPEMMEALSSPTVSGKPSTMPFSVGDISGNKAFEHNFAPQATQDLARKGQEALRNEIIELGNSFGFPATTQEELGKATFKQAKKGLNRELKVISPNISFKKTEERIKLAVNNKIITRELGGLLNAVHKGQSPSSILGPMIQTPESAAAISRVAGKEVVASGWFSNFIDDFSREGAFQGNKALETFSDPRNLEIISKFTNNPQREQIKRLLKRAALIEPIQNAVGDTALRFGQGGLSLSFTGSAAKRITARIKIQDFVEKVMLNPQYARAAAELMALPPESAKARELGQYVFKALKGTQFAIDSQD